VEMKDLSLILRQFHKPSGQNRQKTVCRSVFLTAWYLFWVSN